MRKSSSANKRASTVDSSKNVKTSQNLPTLDEIHAKVSGAAVLNGGFDTLLYKIDKIEQSQGQLVSKVDKIHEAIYDPNDGMFAKLAEHKLDSEVKLNEINKSVTELSTWKTHKEKEDVQDEQIVNKASTTLATLEKSVEGLVKSKETVWGVGKWFFVAIGGGLITLLFSWLEAKLK